jgi:hypothetical protein
LATQKAPDLRVDHLQLLLQGKVAGGQQLQLGAAATIGASCVAEPFW